MSGIADIRRRLALMIDPSIRDAIRPPSAVELALHLSERRRRHVEAHPETAQARAGAAARWRGDLAPNFARAASAELGLSERYVLMITDDQIACLIRALAVARGWSESYAAKRATGSGDTLDRIERGVSLTIRRANRIVCTIDGLWPESLAWPVDIPRPASQERAA